jgi:hypothetical protein
MTSRLLCRDYWITILGFLGRKMLIFNTPKSCFFDNFADKIPKKTRYTYIIRYGEIIRRQKLPLLFS